MTPIVEKDARGTSVRLAAPARRVVSLVPSVTETLFALGAGDRLVGRTRYCVRPRPAIDAVPVVGGTKDPDPAAVSRCRPDLVLANQEENRAEDVIALEELAPVWVAFPRSVDEALDDLATTARLLGVGSRGARRVAAITAAREEAAAGARPFRFACLVWRRPWMAAGEETFCSALLAEAGGRNVVPGRYPEVALDELVAADPDVVVLPDEPFPFSRRHAAELGPLASRARLVDGQMLCWHGVRLEEALPYLASLRLGG